MKNLTSAQQVAIVKNKKIIGAIQSVDLAYIRESSNRYKGLATERIEVNCSRIIINLNSLNNYDERILTEGCGIGFDFGIIISKREIIYNCRGEVISNNVGKHILWEEQGFEILEPLQNFYLNKNNLIIENFIAIKKLAEPIKLLTIGQEVK